MFHGADGLTLDGARAIHRLHEAGVTIVIASGRTVVQLREMARLLGAQDFIAELGSVIVRGRTEQRAYPSDVWGGVRSPQAQAVLKQVLGSFPVEPHEPWFSMREHSLLLRGSPGQADKMRAFLQTVAPGLTAIDNGEIEDGNHAYHVLPEIVSKRHAIEEDLKARGLGPQDAVAFGDSEGDRAMGEVVNTMYHLGGQDGARIKGVPRRFATGLLEAVHMALR